MSNVVALGKYKNRVTMPDPVSCVPAEMTEVCRMALHIVTYLWKQFVKCTELMQKATPPSRTERARV